MALNLSTRYPGRANPPSIDYPQGSFKNKTAPTATDGTLLEQDWANDPQGFLQSILHYRGVTADGQVDKVGASQYFDALTSDPTELKKGMPLVATQAVAEAGVDDSMLMSAKKVLQLIRSTISNASETLRGVLRVGTQAEANAGILDDVAITPKKLRFGFSLSAGEVGHFAFPVCLGGLVVQWGRLPSSGAIPIGGLYSGTVATSTTFPTKCFQVVCSDGGNTALCSYSANGLLSSIQYGIRNVSGDSLVSANGRYIAIGN